MGIIRAAVNAVHGSFADQWLETVEPYEICLLYTSPSPRDCS